MSKIGIEKRKQIYSYISDLANDCIKSSYAIELLEIGKAAAKINSDKDYERFFEAEIVYFRDNDFDKYKTMMLSIESRHYFVLSRIGDYFKLNDQLDQTIKYYDKILENDPQNYEALVCKGNIYLDMDRYDEAMGCYNEVLKKKTDSITALRNKGTLLELMDDKEGAIACFDKVLELEPGNKYAQCEKERLVYDPIAEVSSLDEQLADNPDDYALLKQKAEILYYDFDEKDQALIICDKLLKVRPDDDDVLAMTENTFPAEGYSGTGGYIDTESENEPDNFYALNVKFLTCQLSDNKPDQVKMLDLARQVALKFPDCWAEKSFRDYFEDVCEMDWKDVVGE